MHWSFLEIYTVCIIMGTIRENEYFKSFKGSVLFVYC
jgi:hypothetical protein